MKKIKYFNNELVNQGELDGKSDISTFKPVYELVPQEYLCKDNEFDYWLDIIQRSYGQHGEVTWEEVQDPIDSKEALVGKLAESDILTHKGSYMIEQLAKAVAQLNIEVSKLKGV